jgi:PTH2 family peptidyl-tRNA hydrolase
MKIKMYCILAEESILKMEQFRGKMCTQSGHAILKAYLDAQNRFPDLAAAYIAEDTHQYKITLVVKTTNDLIELVNYYRDKCGVVLITDKGFTVFDEPTITCAGIGPIYESEIDTNISSLKLFK